MGLALTTSLAFCLWVVLWAIGVKSFDAFMITIVIVLIAGTLKSLAKFLPGAGRTSGHSGGW
ncbi:MAG TPA: hypothetical protein VKB25_07250 [Conexibacter sp.]|nr:hypothetical protein [Conexibacter sp.]